MSHCRNSSRQIKYFYVVAFLSVWKNLPFPAANAPRRPKQAFSLQARLYGPEKAACAGSPLLCISADMYGKFVFT
jgi:hypothetical protein